MVLFGLCDVIIEQITMSKALFLVLAALLIVAVVADFDFEEDEAMDEMLSFDKRGSMMNKYRCKCLPGYTFKSVYLYL